MPNSVAKTAREQQESAAARRKAFLRGTDPMLVPATNAGETVAPETQTRIAEPLRGRAVGKDARYVLVSDMIADPENPRTLIPEWLARRQQETAIPVAEAIGQWAEREKIDLQALKDLLSGWILDLSQAEPGGESAEVAPERQTEASKFGTLGSVCELAASIAHHTLLQSMAGEPTSDGRVMMLDGHRRMVALMLLNLLEHPNGIEAIVTIREPRTELGRLLAQHTANQSREALPAADLYDLIGKAKSLMSVEAGGAPVSLRMVARRLNLRQDLVQRLQILGRLSPEARRSLSSGGLPAGLISETLGRTDGVLQTRLMAGIETVAAAGPISQDNYDEILIAAAIGMSATKPFTFNTSALTTQQKTAAVASIRSGIRNPQLLEQAIAKAADQLGSGGQPPKFPSPENLAIQRGTTRLITAIGRAQDALTAAQKNPKMLTTEARQKLADLAITIGKLQKTPGSSK